MFKTNAAVVRSLIFKRGISLEQFARESKLNSKTISRAIAGDLLTVKSLAALARALGVSAETLLLKEE